MWKTHSCEALGLPGRNRSDKRMRDHEGDPRLGLGSPIRAAVFASMPYTMCSVSQRATEQKVDDLDQQCCTPASHRILLLRPGRQAERFAPGGDLDLVSRNKSIPRMDLDVRVSVTIDVGSAAARRFGCSSLSLRHRNLSLLFLFTCRFVHVAWHVGVVAQQSDSQ